MYQKLSSAAVVIGALMVNDLPDNIRVSVRMFADDYVLHLNIYTLQDCLTLQEDRPHALRKVRSIKFGIISN